MALEDLLTRLESQMTDTPATSCNSLGVSVKPAPNKACTLDTADTSQNISAKDFSLFSTRQYRSGARVEFRVTFEHAVDRAVVTTCIDCQYFARPGKSDGYCVRREDLPPAYGENHPLRRLPADRGMTCNQLRRN